MLVVVVVVVVIAYGGPGALGRRSLFAATPQACGRANLGVAKTTD